MRTLEPTRATTSDADFLSGWGGLEVSTPFPVSVGVNGNIEAWRLLLITHEFDASNAQIMRHFCVTWDVNPAAGTLRQTPNTDILPDQAGWNDQSDSLNLASSC